MCFGKHTVGRLKECREKNGGKIFSPHVPPYSPRESGLRREKIPNKLDFSGKVDKYILNNILKVPVNPPWANLEIQDGVQDGCRASSDTSFAPYLPNYWFYADSYINRYYRAY